MKKGYFTQKLLITAAFTALLAVPTSTFASTTTNTQQAPVAEIATVNTVEQSIIDTYTNLFGAYTRSQIAIARLDTKGVDVTNANITLAKTALSLVAVKKDITNKTISEKTLTELANARTLLLQSLTEAKNAINTK